MFFSQCANRCLEEGAEEFIVKPVKLSDVNRLKNFMMGGERKEIGEKVQKRPLQVDYNNAPSFACNLAASLQPPPSSSPSSPLPRCSSKRPRLHSSEWWYCLPVVNFMTRSVPIFQFWGSHVCLFTTSHHVKILTWNFHWGLGRLGERNGRKSRIKGFFGVSLFADVAYGITLWLSMNENPNIEGNILLPKWSLSTIQNSVLCHFTFSKFGIIAHAVFCAVATQSCFGPKIL